MHNIFSVIWDMTSMFPVHKCCGNMDIAEQPQEVMFLWAFQLPRGYKKEVETHFRAYRS